MDTEDARRGLVWPRFARLGRVVPEITKHTWTGLLWL
jgi:hypothetical protein